MGVLLGICLVLVIFGLLCRGVSSSIKDDCTKMRRRKNLVHEDYQVLFSMDKHAGEWKEWYSCCMAIVVFLSIPVCLTYKEEKLRPPSNEQVCTKSGNLMHITRKDGAESYKTIGKCDPITKQPMGSFTSIQKYGRG